MHLWLIANKMQIKVAGCKIQAKTRAVPTHLVGYGASKQQQLNIVSNKCNFDSRFGIIEDQKDAYRLFTIANPLSRSGKQKGLLQQWDPADGALRRTVAVSESLSALAVRDDGRFVGLGTMFSGSVDIYIAFSLQVGATSPWPHAL